MKRLLILAFVFPLFAFAQVRPVRHKIALFAPLYLDSAFEGSSYRFDQTFPKFLNPGLEFYQGAQLALDSLKKAGAPLEVFVYDSRSTHYSIAQRFSGFEFNNMEMIIANASGPDVQTLAIEAQRRQIPFISATFPNDAGVVNNPYFVMLNSTLRTHCESIYQYLQKYHGSDRIVMFRKSGVQETQIMEYFNEMARSTLSYPVKIDFVDLGNDFETSDLVQKLDSTQKNVCIVGSLNERFGLKIAGHLASVSDQYPLSLVGMPTWDGIKEFSRSEFRNMEIVYSTPFYYRKAGGLSAQLISQFESMVSGRPTDMFFRGYEVMLRFALLLLDSKRDVASDLTRRGNNVFTQFNIQPVFLNKSEWTLDYFENKHLYFVKYINGIPTVVN